MILSEIPPKDPCINCKFLRLAYCLAMTTLSFECLKYKNRTRFPKMCKGFEEGNHESIRKIIKDGKVVGIIFESNNTKQTLNFYYEVEENG
jgi:hypothetical protein